MLTEVEKQEIGNSARKYVADLWELSENAVNLKCTPVKDHYEGYIAGSTAMAEKKNVEIESLRNDLLDALDLKEGKGSTALSMLQAELSRLKEIVRAAGYSLEILTDRYGHLGASKEVLTKIKTFLEGEKTHF